MLTVLYWQPKYLSTRSKPYRVLESGQHLLGQKENLNTEIYLS
jgi:hypothetical protein